MNKQTKHKGTPEVERVEWLGMDGVLVLLYAVLATIYAVGIINRIDFIVGVMAPITAISITVFVFLRYCFEVLLFAKKPKK